MAQNPVTYTHIKYDGLGRKSFESQRTIQSDPANAIGKKFEYDTSGRLKAVILPPVTDPNPEPGKTGQVYPRYEYDYDVYGNMTDSTDNIKQYAGAGDPKIYLRERTTSFTYNELHLQTSRIVQ